MIVNTAVDHERSYRTVGYSPRVVIPRTASHRTASVDNGKAQRADVPLSGELGRYDFNFNNNKNQWVGATTTKKKTVGGGRREPCGPPLHVHGKLKKIAISEAQHHKLEVPTTREEDTKTKKKIGHQKK